MMSARSILLRPHCPDQDDPDILSFLELASTCVGSTWAEMHLSLDTGSAMHYRIGHVVEGGSFFNLSSDGFDASLRLDSSRPPPDSVTVMLTFALERILLCRRYNEQVALLRGALDTTTSAVLLFDRQGGIVYANPPADRLLSRQTEDGLLVEGRGKKPQPLVTFLCSKVAEVSADRQASRPWTETLALSDGTVVACEILQLVGVGSSPSSGVLATLQPVPALSKLCLESFCTRHRLSPREEDVVGLLLEGLTTGDMADRLNISVHTVRDHLKRLYRKTGVRSRAGLLSLVSTAGASPKIKQQSARHTH